MAEFRLHCMAQSGNAYRVALMLNLLGADWEPVFVDFFNGETRKPEWRARYNAMGEVPVLEHEGRMRTQSGVILSWLAERFGKFQPQSADDRLEVLRWILFDNHKVNGYLGPYRFLKTLARPPGDPAVLAFLKGRIDGALGVVDGHLRGRDFVVGSAPTIADVSMVGYLFYPQEEHGYDFAAYPGIAPWLARMQALPGWKHPYDLMPGHPLPGRG